MGVTTSTANAGATYVPIATQTLGSSTSTVTFSSISSGYTDLILVCNYTTTVANLDCRLQVNSDTSGNYSYTYLLGQGTGSGTGRLANSSYIGGYFAVGTSTSGNISIYKFQNYANTTTYKTILHRMSSAQKELTANVGLWRSSAAINSIALFTNTNAFAIGSVFTLYGIKAA